MDAKGRVGKITFRIMAARVGQEDRCIGIWRRRIASRGHVLLDGLLKWIIAGQGAELWREL